MKSSRLNADEAVLVVVDMQERLLPAIHNQESVKANTALLMHAAQTLSVPVIVTTQYLKGLGPVVGELSALNPTAPIDKMTFSCFGSPEFRAALDATGRRTILLCGVEAHICVLQTGLDALAAEYSVHLVTDATGSRAPENAVLGHRRLEGAGALLSSAEMAVYEMLGRAGTPAFKAMLPHFK